MATSGYLRRAFLKADVVTPLMGGLSLAVAGEPPVMGGAGEVCSIRCRGLMDAESIS